MKFATVIISLILIVFAGAFMMGFMQDSEIIIEKEIILEVPEAVVFNTLIDFDHYNTWCPQLVENNYNLEKSYRHVRYDLWPEDYVLNESIEINLQGRNIIIRAASDNPVSLLKNFNNNIRLISLPDGTTNLFWQISYRIEPIYSKLINRMLIEPQMESMISNNLEGLQEYLLPD